VGVAFIDFAEDDEDGDAEKAPTWDIEAQQVLNEKRRRRKKASGEAPDMIVLTNGHQVRRLKPSGELVWAWTSPDQG
jgi:hypothetical protein